MDPNKIRFSQASISYRFREGGTIDDLAEGLRTGRIRPENLPPLRLLELHGEWFTLDNRRLEAFRRAGVEAPWRLATPEEIATLVWKFTTPNEGVSVRMRGEQE